MAAGMSYALPSASSSPRLERRTQSRLHLGDDATALHSHSRSHSSSSYNDLGRLQAESARSPYLDPSTLGPLTPGSQSLETPSATSSAASSYINLKALHAHARPTDQMNRSRSRGESDVGRPASLHHTHSASAVSLMSVHEDSLSTGQDHDRYANLPREVLAAVLLPLPFLIASLNNPLDMYIDHSQYSKKTELTEEILRDAAALTLPVPESLLSLIEACSLTAGTLLLMGALGYIKSQSTQARTRKRTLTGTRDLNHVPAFSLLSWQSVKKILLRVLAVALPFLATVEIGGDRVGLVVLSSVVSGLVCPDSGEVSARFTLKKAFTRRRFTLLIFIACLLFDLFWHPPGEEYGNVFRGYMALAKSIFVLQIPLPSFTTHKISATRTGSTWDADAKQPSAAVSPLIATVEDTHFTIAAGVLVTVIGLSLASLLSPFPSVSGPSAILYLLSLAAAGAVYTFVNPSVVRSDYKIGLAFSALTCGVFSVFFEHNTPLSYTALCALCMLTYAAVRLDMPLRRTGPKKGDDDHDSHSHHHHHHSTEFVKCSPFTKKLLQLTEDIPWAYDILSQKESRRISYFMGINLGFMLVQTFYAMLSGSLGLLSDSIHMFFDCIGLFAGLVAAIMSKWPPNSRFPYGYGKIETLSGLGNGIFLMIISVEIIWESVERFTEGAQLKHLSELLIVSCAGLAVNLIGLVFIGHAHHGHSHGHSHGHGHSHHGHSHDSHSQSHSHHDHDHDHSHDHNLEHSHDHHDHDHDHKSNGHSPANSLAEKILPPEVHAHHHDHTNENMVGIYLHILADTMGSVAVIISTILTWYTGWSGWDPIASCLIAILIILASYPLVQGSAKRLLLTVPDEVEYPLRSALGDLCGLPGVVGYATPRFWLDDSDPEQDHGHGHAHGHENGHGGHGHPHAHGHSHGPKHHHGHKRNKSEMPVRLHDEHICGPKVLGVIHVIASRRADLEDVRARCRAFLKERNMDILVHVEREAEGVCWCGGEKHFDSATSPLR